MHRPRGWSGTTVHLGQGRERGRAPPLRLCRAMGSGCAEAENDLPILKTALIARKLRLVFPHEGDPISAAQGIHEAGFLWRYVHSVLGLRPCAVIPFPIQNQVGMPRRPLCRYSGVVHSPLHFFASMPANCSLTSLSFILLLPKSLDLCLDVCQNAIDLPTRDRKPDQPPVNCSPAFLTAPQAHRCLGYTG